MKFEKFDKREFASIGIRFKTNRETAAFAEIIREELEVRIGEEISSRFSDRKLAEFDRCSTPEECSRWLRENCPDYRKIVEKKKREFEQELIEYRLKIPGLMTSDNSDPDNEEPLLIEPIGEYEDCFDVEEDFDEELPGKAGSKGSLLKSLFLGG